MRHRFHSICPYFAMFPEQFVQKHLVWAAPGDLILDPFSGRGTTVFESALSGREAIGGDTNPVAVCVSRAKADPPTQPSVLRRIDELEAAYGEAVVEGAENLPDFFRHCFHRDTLPQVLFLRRELRWRTRRVDRFVAALALGCLHGESHKSKWCFSNRMPRTISTKPAYSVAWWKAHGHAAPKRDVFEVLRGIALYRFQSPQPPVRARVAHVDARHIAGRFPDAKRRVGVVITSPPYLDTTNFQEDQWLRLWFLGGPDAPRPKKRSDDRHRGAEGYWRFLTDAWAGMEPLLRDGAHVIIRIGGRHIDAGSAESRLRASLREGTGARVRLFDRRSSRIRNGQLQAFRPGAEGTQVEHDFHFRIY